VLVIHGDANRVLPLDKTAQGLPDQVNAALLDFLRH
jgi:hypothetical protein